ncbi:MAG: LemA family protein [Leptothrix sp. (in: b-proteobacteria)]
MPTRILLALIAIVLGLWALGAYNRLVRLRNAMLAAFSPLVGQLRQRHAVALTLAEASSERMGTPAELVRVEQLRTAARRAGLASDQVQGNRLRAGALQQLAVAEETLMSALDDLVEALQDLTSGTGPDPTVSGLLRQRDMLQEQIRFSRQLYNQASDEHNRALALFPTTLVATLYGFHSAPEFPPI